MDCFFFVNIYTQYIRVYYNIDTIKLTLLLYLVILYIIYKV